MIYTAIPGLYSRIRVYRHCHYKRIYNIISSSPQGDILVTDIQLTFGDRFLEIQNAIE